MRSRRSTAWMQLEPLHWNEDRFEPPRRVLEAAAAEVFNAALYPERLFADFRDGVAALARRALGVRHAGARRAGADRVGSPQVFVGPGTPVVVPHLTYGLYAAVSAAAGRSRHARPARRARDRPRRAWPTAALATGRPRWSGSATRTTRPARSSSPPRGTSFLARLPADCIVIADETYIDFADPAVRADRPRDVLEGRPVIAIRSFSKIFGLAGLRLGFAISDPAGRAAARPRAGAVQRQPRRARRGHRRPSPSRPSSSAGAPRSPPRATC